MAYLSKWLGNKGKCHPVYETYKATFLHPGKVLYLHQVLGSNSQSRKPAKHNSKTQPQEARNI